MAFCRNCGSEVPEGTKFCSNCGTSVEIQAEALKLNDEPMKDIAANAEVFPGVSQMMENQVEEPVSKLDKFGKFYGIILMILVFVDFQSDPAALTIVLSVAIIAGCIFCFSKKYKLKGFTIVALILAIFCLLSGISQAKKIGLFKVPGSDKVVETTVEETYDKETPVVENKVEEKTEEVKETPVVEAVEEKEEQIVEEESVQEEKETINGVDPDLKAFLDSYEAFMDEYVDFMKKYMNDPGNAISMLTEYTEIMVKYEDFADKIDKYDSDSMSTEDAKYYLEVVNRCNQKMLEMY